MDAPTDRELREMAESRVAFRRTALAYALVNAFLVGVWYVTSYEAGEGLGGFWPIWPILGWGVGLAYQGWCAYGGGDDAVRREEERLRTRYGRT